MKKILFSIFVAAVAVTSCTKFDDAVSEVYADGPAVSIDVTKTTDSTFTFTVAPATGAQWYSYVVVKATAPKELAAATLLKGGYSGVSGAVIESAKQATVLDSMRVKGAPLCSPNTSYVIYAVAANDKGMTGAVASKVVKTTDGNAPESGKFTAGTDGSVAVSFSEAVVRGEGKVSAKYYKEFDFENSVEVADTALTVEVSGATVKFSVDSLPAGVYVTYSFEEGAFADAAGLKCGAVNTIYNEAATSEKDLFLGYFAHVENKNFAIADSMLLMEDGQLVADWKSFVGTIKFAFPIYVDEESKADGDLMVTYATASRKVSVNLKPTDWTVSTEDSVLVFRLPECPDADSKVTVSLTAGIVFDVCGNSNEAFTSKVAWRYAEISKETILGTYSGVYTNNKGVKKIMAPFTISAAEKDTVIIKDLLVSGSELVACYDSIMGRLVIPGDQYAGQSGDYYLFVYDPDGEDDEDPISFNIAADGTLSNIEQMGFYACDENGKGLGWLLKIISSKFSIVK